MRRAIPFAVAIFTALLLQTTVFPKVTLVGAKPELVYLVVIIMAMLDGPSVGAVIGFSGGMAQDFLQNTPKGVTALTLTLLGYAVGLARTYIVTPSPLLPMMIVGLGTSCGLLFFGIVSALIGQLATGWLYLFKIAFFSGIYNGLLTPVFYPLLKRISEGDRSRSLFGR